MRLRQIKAVGKFAGLLILLVLTSAALRPRPPVPPSVPDHTALHTPRLEAQLAEAIADRYRASKAAASAYAAQFIDLAKTYRGDPILYAAIAGAESSYRENARSPYGAVGLMQVVPRVHHAQLRADGLLVHKPEHNIIAGVRIFEMYRKVESGDVVGALQRYNGSRHDRRRAYTHRVAHEYRALLAKLQPRVVLRRNAQHDS